MKNDIKEDKIPFPRQAAKSSWMLFILILLFLMLASKIVQIKLIIDFLVLLIAIIAVILGIIALFGIPKCGSKKILFPALTGIIINGFLVTIWVTNFLRICILYKK